MLIRLLRQTVLLLSLTCGFQIHAADPSVRLERSGSKIDVSVDGVPFTSYYFSSVVAKPYLMPLRTAKGVVITRGFPIANDVSAGDPKGSSFEPHQRPLYFSHGNIDGLDFWQEPVFDKFYTD